MSVPVQNQTRRRQREVTTATETKKELQYRFARKRCPGQYSAGLIRPRSKFLALLHETKDWTARERFKQFVLSSAKGGIKRLHSKYSFNRRSIWCGGIPDVFLGILQILHEGRAEVHLMKEGAQPNALLLI